MKKIFAISLLLVLPAPAMAGVAQHAKPEQSAARHTDYWLSTDLNRLVFWQPGSTSIPRR